MTATIHTQRARCTGYAEPLPLRSGTVTLDEAWAPYAQARLELAGVPALLDDALDPRLGHRLHLWLDESHVRAGTVADISAAFAGGTVADISAAFAGGTVADITAAFGSPIGSAGYAPGSRRMLNLAVRSREYRDGVILLEACSDELLLMDYGRTYDLSWWPANNSVRNIVSQVLGFIGATLTAGAGDGRVQLDATEWRPGMSAWDYLAPLVQSAGLRLWCDEARRWRLEPTLGSTPGELELAGPQVTRAGDRITRGEDWFDAVVVEYRWRDALDVERVEYDVAADSRFSRTEHVRIDRPFPGYGAAAARLARRRGRGRTLELEAIANYAATPGQAVTATLPEYALGGRVASVRWAFDADRDTPPIMTVEPRDVVVLP